VASLALHEAARHGNVAAWDIYNALRDGDAERARAADLIHLSEGVRRLEQLIEAEEAIGVLSDTP
jgi:hypothetical protein